MSQERLPFLDAAVQVMLRGGTLIYPTETVYGIGGRADDEALICAVQRCKGRDADKPMLILTDEWARADTWIQTPSATERRLMHTEHPITLLFTPTKRVPKALRGLSEWIGIRRTRHPFCRALIQQTQCLLLSTSANPSGELPVNDLQFLPDTFLKQVDFVVDYGALPPASPSTVVRCLGNEPRILREGDVSVAQLTALLRD